MIGERFVGDLWLLLLVQSTSCLAVGLAVSYALRHRPAHAHQVLFTGLLASVFMPGLYLSAKRCGLGVLVPQMTSQTQETIETGPLDSLLLANSSAAEIAYEPMPSPITEVPAPATVPWGTVAAVCWVVIATALLIRLVLRFILGLHVVHTARPLENERLCRALEAAKSKLGIRRSVGIRCSEKVRSPVIWCWGREPVLLVHEDASPSQDNPDWVGVFCHELSHWKRFDHLSGLCAEVLAALFPWHPLVWWTKGRLLKLSEQVCDDWVLASGQIGLDYAESLLDLAPAGQAAFVPTIAGKEKAMKERIRRIVKNGCGNPRIGIRWVIGVSALAVLVSVGVALAQQRPAATEQREGEPRPEIRQEQVAPRPAIVGRRNVLVRLRDQLQQQVRDTEAAIRQRGDEAPEEGRVLRAELDTLHEQIQRVEEQLREFEGGPRRVAPAQPRPSQPRAQVEYIRQRRAELAEETRRIEQRLRELRPEQDQEARELHDRLQMLHEQVGDTERQLADLQRRRAESERPGARRRATEFEEQSRLQIATIEQELRERREQGKEEDSPESQALADRLRTLTSELRQIEETRAVPEPPRVPRNPEQAAAAREPGTRKEIRVFQLRHAGPERMRGIVQSVLGEAGQATAEERTRTLVITTPPENMARVEGLLRELDVPPSDRGSEGELEELRNQMRGLTEQMQQIQIRLDQIAERHRAGERNEPPSNGQPERR